MDIMNRLGQEYLYGAERLKIRIEELKKIRKNPDTPVSKLNELDDRTNVLYMEYLQMTDTGNKLIHYYDDLHMEAI